MTDSPAPQSDTKPLRTLYIHGGMHKTGSSALQNYLCQQLDHPEFEYFSVGKSNSSLIVLQCFNRRLARLPEYQAREFTRKDFINLAEKARKRFVNGLEMTKKENVILSAESFSLLTREECEDLRDVVSENFATVKLVLYIRPVRERVESAFQQKLKYRFVDLEQKITPNFKQRISKYDEIFGRENVLVRCFDPASFVGGNVVNDFLETVGLPNPVENDPPANVGLSLAAVQLLYIYRMRYRLAIPEDTKLVRRLEALKGEKFSLHQDLLDRILDDRIERFPRAMLWFQKLAAGIGINSRMDHGLLGRIFVRRNDSYRWLAKRAGISVVSDYSDADNAVRKEEDLVSVPDSSLEWLQQHSEVEFEYSAQQSPDLEAIAGAMRELALAI